MRTAYVIRVAFLLWAGIVSFRMAHAQDDEAIVRKLTEELVTANRIENPLPIQRLQEVLAEQVTVIMGPGNLLKDRNAILALYSQDREQLQAQFVRLTTKCEIDSVRVFDQTAIVIARAESTGERREGNTPFHYVAWVTFVFHKEKEGAQPGWRLVHGQVTAVPVAPAVPAVPAPDIGPFTGPINAAVMDKESTVLIVPTHETDKAAQDAIRMYVKMIQLRFFPDCPILTDDEALKKDLFNNTIVVYGTPTGNLWLTEQIAEHPVRIEPDRIAAGAEYPGTNLRFITAWPNPQNPQKGMVIYTAQQAADVVGINGVFHGPTDFVVAQGTTVLKAADYNKNGRPWVFP